MVNRNKAKGAKFEREIVVAMRAAGYKRARRGVAGATEDVGDITGVPYWCLEAKDRQTHSFPAYAREAEQESESYGTRYWAVIAKRPRKPISEAFVLIPFKTWLKLICTVRDQKREIHRLQVKLLED